MNNGKVVPSTSVNAHQMQSIGPSTNILITSNRKETNDEDYKYTEKGVSKQTFECMYSLLESVYCLILKLK